MVTKNGIELNLKDSNFRASYGKLLFYFSSKFYLNKFKKELETYIFTEHIKIYNKYKIKIDLSEYLSLALYKRIEKRGFLVKDVKTNRKIKENEIIKM